MPGQVPGRGRHGHGDHQVVQRRAGAAGALCQPHVLCHRAGRADHLLLHRSRARTTTSPTPCAPCPSGARRRSRRTRPPRRACRGAPARGTREHQNSLPHRTPPFFSHHGIRSARPLHSRHGGAETGDGAAQRWRATPVAPRRRNRSLKEFSPRAISCACGRWASSCSSCAGSRCWRWACSSMRRPARPSSSP